jgi:hypothetical protein
MKQLDDMYFWWYDESVRWFLIWYYWPNFVMGNSDEIGQIISSVSLNGIKLNNICNPNKV